MQKSFGSFCCACQISLSNVGIFACEKLLIEMQTFFLRITNKPKGVKEAISWNGAESSHLLLGFQEPSKQAHGLCLMR